jgi:hypothetical protein
MNLRHQAVEGLLLPVAPFLEQFGDIPRPFHVLRINLPSRERKSPRFPREPTDADIQEAGRGVAGCWAGGDDRNSLI